MPTFFNSSHYTVVVKLIFSNVSRIFQKRRDWSFVTIPLA
jgi:hypothetical protein